MINAFKKEAVKLAEAVEIEKKRAIGYRLLLDTLKRKKENEQRQVMVKLFNALATLGKAQLNSFVYIG